MRGLRRAPECSTCRWPLERGAGHWLGGSEICMVATFWIVCLAAITFHRFVPLSWVTMTFTAAATVGVSLAVYRVSRSLFCALDYAIDPVAERSGDGDSPDRGVPVPPPRSPGGLRTGVTPVRAEPSDASRPAP